MGLIIRPFATEVWIFSLLSIPIFVMTMGLANYILLGRVGWNGVSGFALRIVFVEPAVTLFEKYAYQRLFSIVWIMSFFVLAKSYSGALTALITKPTLDMPIRNVEELLNQNEISWSIEDGIAVIEFLKASPPNSRLRRLVEGARLLPSSEMSGCYIKGSEAKQSGLSAPICDINSIMTLLSQDYSETGTCNYYLTEEKFQLTSNAMALQAS